MNSRKEGIPILGDGKMVLEVSVFFQLVVDPVHKGQLFLFREAVCGSWVGQGGKG